MLIPKGETTAPSIYARAYGASDTDANNRPLWLNVPHVTLARTWGGPFLNVRTGKYIRLRSADCGLDCYCAAEWKLAK